MSGDLCSVALEVLDRVSRGRNPFKFLAVRTAPSKADDVLLTYKCVEDGRTCRFMTVVLQTKNNPHGDVAPCIRSDRVARLRCFHHRRDQAKLRASSKLPHEDAVLSKRDQERERRDDQRANRNPEPRPRIAAAVRADDVHLRDASHPGRLTRRPDKKTGAGTTTSAEAAGLKTNTFAANRDGVRQASRMVLSIVSLVVAVIALAVNMTGLQRRPRIVAEWGTVQDDPFPYAEGLSIIVTARRRPVEVDEVGLVFLPPTRRRQYPSGSARIDRSG